MSLIGYIEQFNPAKSDITSYIERLEQLFICNVVEEDKEVPLLISLIGGETYSVLKDLLAPEVPSSKTFEELKRVLIEHYSPKRLVIAERYKFYNTNQEPQEDIKSFVSKLKSVAQYCKFGQFLKECLRDRFVCGVRSVQIRHKLLAVSNRQLACFKDNISFERAYEIALSIELTKSQVRRMEQENVAAIEE
ncbi:uncharacterized protein [Diabrotica undecimpunctata]|uniref:uncharacterized protein n=1 Tax=Diabrotica undecimpunctata TaxID=50387 RepID=UPI003B63F6CA